MAFKMMCFKVFSKWFQWFSKLCSSNCFQNFPIGFNGFQNDVFQSVFNMVSMVFKIMFFKLFSNYPIGCNGFQNDVLQKCFQNSP